MPVFCTFGFHRWNKCRCENCGKTRDEDHDWKKDCEKCAVCGKVRQAAHNWDGRWVVAKSQMMPHVDSPVASFGTPLPGRCRCYTCGKTRDEGHDWKKDCEKCAVCGKVRQAAHNWVGCRCPTCGKTRDEAHDWKMDCEKCAVCGATRMNAHKWNRDICSVCNKSKAEYLCRNLRQEDDEARRIKVIKDLGKTGDVYAVDTLCEVQGDSAYKTEEQRAAINALCHIGRPAIKKLCYIAGGTIYDTLATTMANKYRHDLALEALVKIGRQNVDELCLILLAHSKESEGAARALAKIRDPNAKSSLLAAIKTDTDSSSRLDVRVLAKEALVKIDGWADGLDSTDVALVESIKYEGVNWGDD